MMQKVDCRLIGRSGVFHGHVQLELVASLGTEGAKRTGKGCLLATVQVDVACEIALVFVTSATVWADERSRRVRGKAGQYFRKQIYKH